MGVTQNIFCITFCCVFFLFVCVYCKHSHRLSPARLVPVRITVGISHNFASAVETPPTPTPTPQKKENKPLWNSSIIIVGTQPTQLPLGCIRWSSSSKKYKFSLACMCLCLCIYYANTKCQNTKTKQEFMRASVEGTLQSLLCITGVFLHRAT